TLHALEPSTPPARVRTLDDFVDESIAQRRFQLELIAFFAAAALALAALGVYGVVAQSVAERTREIGVRFALGATRDRVWRLIASQELLPVAIGLAIGVGGAVVVGRGMRDLLFGVTSTDPATLGAVAVVLVGSSVLACAVPARRAARVDPMVA